MVKWLMLLGCCTLAGAQESRRVLLAPVDFKKGDHEVTLTGIHQIESDGSRLYLRSNRDLEIFILTPDGRCVGKIGGKGDHPSQFGYQGILAMAVRGSELWALDQGIQRLRYFVDGDYIDSFPLGEGNYNLLARLPTSNVFAFSRDRLVIPTHPIRGYLAAVKGFDGTLIQHVGELLSFPQKLMDRIPAMNDTLWLRHGQGWISIHKFFPLVVRYDEDFKPTHHFEIKSEAVDLLAKEVMEFEPKPGLALPRTVFSDAKLFRGDLYLMSLGRLHRVDLETGEVKSVVSFYGEGADFAKTTQPNVTLFFFAFLDDGQLFVAHPAMLWNHDFWTVPGLGP